jgi:hypothetical protein
MELAVRGLFGERWPITVRGPAVTAEDVRLALATQHEFYPANSVFAYEGAVLDEDSAVAVAPNAALTVVDCAVYPRKAFATVDNAFGFGGTRYSPFYQGDGGPGGAEQNGRPGDGGDLLGLMRAPAGHRPADRESADERAVARLHRYTNVDVGTVRRVFEESRRDEFAALRALRRQSPS